MMLKCSQCNSSNLDENLAPLCCQTHQLCINCYCKLPNIDSLSQLCYCCPRYQIYHFQPDLQNNQTSQFVQSQDLPNQKLVNNICKQGDSFQELDHIAFIHPDQIEIRAFYLQYVCKHFIPDKDKHGYTNFNVDISLIKEPEHTPLFKYYIPIQFIQSDPSDKIESYLIQHIQGSVLSTILGFLNSFRFEKQINNEALINLILNENIQIIPPISNQIPQKYRDCQILFQLDDQKKLSITLKPYSI